MRRNVKHETYTVIHSSSTDKGDRYIYIYPAALSRYHKRRILYPKREQLIEEPNSFTLGTTVAFHVKVFFSILKAAETGKVKRSSSPPGFVCALFSLQKCSPMEQRDRGAGNEVE